MQATIGNRALARLAREGTARPSRVLARFDVSQATRALEEEARAVAERLFKEIGLGETAARAGRLAPGAVEGGLTIAGTTLGVTALATGWALLYERGARDWRTKFEAQARRSMIASHFPDCIGEEERRDFILTGHLLIPHACWAELAGTAGASVTHSPVDQPGQRPDREPLAGTRTSVSPNRLGQARLRVERELAIERARVAATRRAASPKQWRRMRSGATKKLYNLLERRAVLNLVKTFPGRDYLEQARVVGVLCGATLIRTKRISRSGKGRIADAAEIEGTSVTLIDFKSDSTFLASIKGGLSAPDVDANFRAKSEIAAQHQVEREILEQARRLGCTVVLRGNDPLTGEVVVIEVDPDRVSSRVTGYNDVGRN